MNKKNIVFKFILLFFNLKILNFNLLYSKKGISPVIATALFLIVTVISVVAFQNWFNTYQSSMQANIETNKQNYLNIENLVSGFLYINGAAEIQSLKINGNDCHVSGVTNENINALPISNCTSIGLNELVLVTNKGVFTKKIWLNLPYTNPCPQGYILVPGNIELGTKNFCVMKYEAKAYNLALEQVENRNSNNLAGFKPYSSHLATPWVGITWTNAKTACESLGSGYKLINDNEWLSIAKNIEKVASNWNSSIIGSGFIYLGHSDNYPSNSLAADINDSNGYYGTEDGISSPGDNEYHFIPNGDARGYQGQKRTLTLSNGEVIWDLAGNIWEWVDDSISAGLRYHGGDQGWMSYNANDGTGKNALNIPILKLPSSNWNANNGMGRYYDGLSLDGAKDDGTNCGPGDCWHTAVFVRGGTWASALGSGIFSLGFDHGPWDPGNRRGFRCSFTP